MNWVKPSKGTSEALTTGHQSKRIGDQEGAELMANGETLSNTEEFTVSLQNVNKSAYLPCFKSKLVIEYRTITKYTVKTSVVSWPPTFFLFTYWFFPPWVESGISPCTIPQAYSCVSNISNWLHFFKSVVWLRSCGKSKWFPFKITEKRTVDSFRSVTFFSSGKLKLMVNEHHFLIHPALTSDSD